MRGLRAGCGCSRRGVNLSPVGVPPRCMLAVTRRREVPMASTLKRFGGQLVAAAALVGGIQGRAEADMVVDYSKAFSVNTIYDPAYNTAGLKVTTTSLSDPSNKNVLSFSSYGLGVTPAVPAPHAVGTLLLDDGESVRFSFNSGPATKISFTLDEFTSFGYDPPDRDAFEVSAVGENGKELPSFPMKSTTYYYDTYGNVGNEVTIDLSKLYSDVPITSFSLTAGSRFGFAVEKVAFDPPTSTIPEPSTFVGAALAALSGLGYAWRRRQAA